MAIDTTTPDPQIDSIAPPLHSRRLRLRNAHVRASPLPSGPPYYNPRRRRSSSTSSRPSLPRSKTTGNTIEDYGWESAEEDEDTGSGDDSHLFRRHTYNSATLSTASLLSATGSATERGGGGRVVSPSYSYGSSSSSVRRNRSRDANETHYIEYLERQLKEVNDRLQNIENPTSNNSQTQTIRRLNQEVKHLKAEVEEWEMRYDLTVKEHNTGLVQMERGLRAEIQKLETKVEAAEERARVAGSSLQLVRKKCDELRGVEEENRVLEVRLQALSEMLAESAREVVPESAVQSRRTSLRIPIRGSSSGTSEHPVKKKDAGSPEQTPTNPRRQLKPKGSVIGPGFDDPTDPVDEVTDHDERSISAMSSSAPNYSTSNGLPHSPSTESLQSLTSSTSRRMRRFRSGTEPKTLIIPSATAIGAGGFGGNFYSPPASECDQVSRPASVCSTRSLPTSDYPASEYQTSEYPTSEYGRLANMNGEGGDGLGSLFAELSNMDYDPDRMSISGTTNPPDSIPHTPASHAHCPPSPSLSDAFSLLPGPLTRNSSTTSFKLLDHALPDPSTFTFPKRSSMNSLPQPQTRNRGLTIRPTNRNPSLTSNPYTVPISLHDTLSPPLSSSMTRSLSSPSLHPEPHHHLCHACGALNSITPRNTVTRPPPQQQPPTHLSTPSSTATTHHPRRRRARSRTPVPPRRHRALSISFGKEGVDDAVDAIWLWIRFIIAVVVALGLAFKDGPQVVITDADHEREEEEEKDAFDHVRDEERERALMKLEGMGDGVGRGEEWIEH
ncbi:hypothetical protein EX30DRAFT_396133 [Ascodesmis nigricans]|uniref:Uncharacterized protein n=1 Tax=Ascodesmis nigricans TaxID=341454 RepID=A0A4S2MVN9_9PEZI|nr:hypothetical protein EX30DRAFT_396133 [Ascodesmis nigricans]